jgi:hypothetical protein
MHEAVKVMGIMWVGVLTFAFAFFISKFLDKMTPPLDRSKGKARTFLEVCTQFGLIGAILYWSRVLIKNVPFPFEGWYGYEHAALGELRSLPLFVFIFMFFQARAQEKMRFLAGI